MTKSFAQKLSTNVYAIDLRNHGDSPHNPDMSISSMSQDVSHFLDTQNIEKAHVLGHSMYAFIVIFFVKLSFFNLCDTITTITPSTITPTTSTMKGWESSHVSRNQRKKSVKRDHR